MKHVDDVDAYLADSDQWPAEIAAIRPVLLSCGLDEDFAPELRERLADDAELAAAFESLTPGRQREYNLHVGGAKQAETRHRRIDNVTAKILAGKGLRD